MIDVEKEDALFMKLGEICASKNEYLYGSILHMESLIRNISDTARWVAVFRADESDRPDAVFHDRFARRLAGEQGAAIADSIEFARQNSWAFVARTWLFDQFIRQHVDSGYDTVINLAAGLDTRPYRMPLPEKLQWIEVDLPGILEYKINLLAAEKSNCLLSRTAVDLADRQQRDVFFDAAGKKAGKALVVSEGLIGYLDRDAAAALAADLSAQPSFQRWVIDLMSPGLLAMAQAQMGAYLQAAKAPLKFAPAEGEGFFLPYGWLAVESKSLLKTAAGLNRLSAEMMAFATHPEPEGPRGDFPWSGVCLFDNVSAKNGRV